MRVGFIELLTGADDKIEGHKERCVLYPSFSSPPPLSAPDRGDTGSRVSVMGR